MPNYTNQEFDIIASLQASLQSLLNEVMSFLPELVAALLILIAGFVIGGLLGKAVTKVFKKLQLDTALDKAGVDDLSSRAGFAFKPAAFAGALVKWFIILAFTVVALNVLNLESVTQFMGEILAYLPKVLAAALILFVGMIAANAVKAIVEGAVRSAQTISSDKAGLLGSVTYYAVIAFALMAALNQMEIAPELIQILFSGLVFGLSLAFGLAFGLGGRSTAATYLDKLSGNNSQSRGSESSNRM